MAQCLQKGRQETQELEVASSANADKSLRSAAYSVERLPRQFAGKSRRSQPYSRQNERAAPGHHGPSRARDGTTLRFGFKECEELGESKQYPPLHSTLAV
jgi:hypothetical protein